ncbi:MAG TPA: hypothetical protein VGQ52_13750 [Gemmatimonadaceae bacterium]|jgi:hypothetical protein|nr:hypothetical protein [Gemmatimonadaceae bacterium]
MLDRVHPICLHCDEPIRPGDPWDTTADGQPWHMECLMRLAIGSVAHIERRCGCYVPGATDNDPPGMTRRQAARAAVDAYRHATFGAVLNTDRACPDCGSKEFHPGPWGGTARNVKCAGCGAKFWFCPPFQPKRIDNSDEVYDLTRVERL